jgi:hypothetical protein
LIKREFARLSAIKQHAAATTAEKMHEEANSILDVARLFVMTCPPNIPEYNASYTRLLDVIFGQKERYVTAVYLADSQSLGMLLLKREMH